ncbi:MAG: hypothetical protein AAF602_21575, partial [Myxococcota bacterium]
SVASACLLLGSFCVGGMGVLWFGILVLVGVFGAAVGGGAAALTTVMEIPVDWFYAGGTLYLTAILMMSVVAFANLVGGGLGLLAAVRGLSGRAWGLRTAAVVHIIMALVFGLPGLFTMNPLALVWAAVLVLSIATLVTVPATPPRLPGLGTSQ